MKIKVSKKELYECVERAVIRAYGEAKAKALNEGYCDDDDDDDPVSRFLKNPKNRLPKRLPGGGAAKKAAMADIKKETDAEKHDEKAAADAEEKEMHGED